MKKFLLYLFFFTKFVTKPTINEDKINNNGVFEKIKFFFTRIGNTSWDSLLYDIKKNREKLQVINSRLNHYINNINSQDNILKKNKNDKFYKEIIEIIQQTNNQEITANYIENTLMNEVMKLINAKPNIPSYSQDNQLRKIYTHFQELLNTKKNILNIKMNIKKLQNNLKKEIGEKINIDDYKENLKLLEKLRKKTASVENDINKLEIKLSELTTKNDVKFNISHNSLNKNYYNNNSNNTEIINEISDNNTKEHSIDLLNTSSEKEYNILSEENHHNKTFCSPSYENNKYCI